MSSEWEFDKFLKESQTPEGRKRQEAESQRILIQHGRASDLEVDDDEGSSDTPALPPPLKKESETLPHDGASSTEARWASLKKEHGTTRFG